MPTQSKGKNLTESIDPDHELMLRVAVKDIAAYRELVSRHLNKMVRVAERMLGDRQDAEDVMQEVCLAVWDNADKWKPKAKFSTWLHRVVINACIDRQRKVIPFAKVDMNEIVDSRQGKDEAMIDEQNSKNVRNALQKLPDRQRAAIILSYYEEMSNQAAADALGVRLNAFQQLLFRGKQNLKELLLNGGEKNG